MGDACLLGEGQRRAEWRGGPRHEAREQVQGFFGPEHPDPRGHGATVWVPTQPEWRDPSMFTLLHRATGAGAGMRHPLERDPEHTSERIMSISDRSTGLS